MLCCSSVSNIKADFWFIWGTLCLTAFFVLVCFCGGWICSVPVTLCCYCSSGEPPLKQKAFQLNRVTLDLQGERLYLVSRLTLNIIPLGSKGRGSALGPLDMLWMNSLPPMVFRSGTKLSESCWIHGEDCFDCKRTAMLPNILSIPSMYSALWFTVHM